MKPVLIIICLSFFMGSAAQDFTTDTIRLDDISIDRSLKKPKLKKIKIGTHDLKYTDNILFFTEEPIYYFIDNLPLGKLQDISLFFIDTAIKPKIGFRDYKTFKIEKTEFEVTLFEVGDDYSVGLKINREPMHIVLEETDSDRLKKVELNLIPYNITAKQFYIQLKKITETNCKECYYHAPVLYKTPDGYHYIYNNKNKVYTKPDKACVFCYGLQTIVKTLTQDY